MYYIIIVIYLKHKHIYNRTSRLILLFKILSTHICLKRSIHSFLNSGIKATLIAELCLFATPKYCPDRIVTWDSYSNQETVLTRCKSTWCEIQWHSYTCFQNRGECSTEVMTILCMHSIGMTDDHRHRRNFADQDKHTGNRWEQPLKEKFCFVCLTVDLHLLTGQMPSVAFINSLCSVFAIEVTRYILKKISLGTYYWKHTDSNSSFQRTMDWF